MSIDKTLKERGSRYGEFGDHAYISQSLQDHLRENKNWSSLPSWSKEAMFMILHKMARIVNGGVVGANYKDNWHDIQGYARLAEDLCEDDN